MRWARSTITSLRCDPWTIAKVLVSGVASYELWHDKRPHAVGSYSTAEAAKAAAEREEMAGQA